MKRVRKYYGKINPGYRADLIQMHLDIIKVNNSPGYVNAWRSNGHLNIIGYLADTNITWNLYRVLCKELNVNSYKPIRYY